MGWIGRVVGAGAGYAVAGVGGAIVGAHLGGGRDSERGGLRDVPYGVHVEEEHVDDAVGRLWKLRLLSEVPEHASVEVRLITDAGARVAGHPPFADGDGGFVATAPIQRGACAVYVPWGAAQYASAKFLSLEVKVVSANDEKVGMATLDADMPPPRAWSPTDFYAPVVALCAKATQDVDAMLTRLVDELGLDEGATTTLRTFADQPLAEAAKLVRHRFPNVTGPGWLELLDAVCFDPATVTAAQRAQVAEIATHIS